MNDISKSYTLMAKQRISGQPFICFCKELGEQRVNNPLLCCSTPEENIGGLETGLRRITRKLFSLVKQL